jgi:hypothetical protein
LSFFGKLMWALVVLALAACGPNPDIDSRGRWGRPKAGAERPGTESPRMGLPDYHLPFDWWRDNHPLLVDGKHGRGRRFFSQGECLACHVPRQTCLVCHQYVGAPEVEGD